MGVCLPDKIDCPKCGGTDTVQLFEQEDGACDAFCFRCRTPFDPDQTADLLNGYTPKPARQVSPEQVKEQIQEVLECPVVAIPQRGLTEATAKYFQVRTGYSSEDGVTPDTWHFPLTKQGPDNKPFLCGFKNRLIEEKRMWNTPGVGGCELFGWQKALKQGGKTLYITEGEFDCMSVHQVLAANADKRGYSRLFSVVSLPLGAGSTKKYIGQHVKDIQRLFKEVRLVFDQDEAGQKAEKEAVLALEGTDLPVFICKLPYKDANEALLAGDEQAILKACIFEQQQAEQSGVVFDKDLWEQAQERPAYGLELPWPTLTKKLRGMRYGETWYWGSGEKMGKSVMVDQLGEWFIRITDQPVYFCKPEEQPHLTLQRLAGKAVGKVFHDPDIPFDQEAFDEGRSKIEGRCVFEDVYAKADWNQTKRNIRWAHNTLGCRIFFLDPLTTFAASLDSSKANDFLQMMAQELALLMKEINSTAHIFCHLKTPQNRKAFTMGGRITTDDFAGSRAMAKFCHVMLGIEGNKDPDQPKGATDLRDIVILADRNFGQTGRVPLKYSHQTGVLTEISEQEKIRIQEGLYDEEQG